MQARLRVWFVAWFAWQLPAAIREDYVLVRRIGPPRWWCFRMACWVNLDAGWAALTGRPLPAKWLDLARGR